MKRSFAVILLIIAITQTYAHEPALPTQAGHWDFALNWGATGGFDNNSIIAFSSDGAITNVVFCPLTSEYNVSYGGSILMARYGITDWLSVGMRSGLLDMVVYTVKDNVCKYFTSAFIDVNILRAPSDTLNFSTELWASPLFSFPTSNWMGDGLWNTFNILAYNHQFIEGTGPWDKPLKVFGYVELKHIASWVNEAYGARTFDLNQTFPTLSQEERDAIATSYALGNKLALTIGSEVNLGNGTLNVGINLPLVKFSYAANLSALTTEYIDSLLTGGLWFNNFELSWCYRF